MREGWDLRPLSRGLALIGGELAQIKDTKHTERTKKLNRCPRLHLVPTQHLQARPVQRPHSSNKLDRDRRPRPRRVQHAGPTAVLKYAEEILQRVQYPGSSSELRSVWSSIAARAGLLISRCW
ncbi:unnamed protein product [Mycena citricolor]|uniref:Uncharacterized protein n=1 Tax=Mycena citricolor TaxID=2018698 RepID=A0AAD2Q6D1_9AGAR|nr:unnamed protein product [Mycena citricolor]